MMFLNPLLLIGLAGVSLPIAIHLFNRFRPKSVEWAAMELLRSAMASRAKQVKVEDWLLLVLRCLAVLLLAFALSRPTLTSSITGGFGGSPRVGVVIAIDGSYSMGHHTGVASRFDAALGRTRDVLETLDPGSPLTLVILAREPRVLLRNAGYEPDQVESLLRDLKPEPSPLSVDAGLDALHELVQEIRSSVREVYVVTDAQSSSWRALPAGARAAMQRLEEEGSVAILPVRGERSDNLAVTRLELTAGTPRVGGSARYVATVRNFGDRPQANVRVRLAQDGQAVDQRVIDELPPSGEVDVSLTARFVQSGVSRLSAEIEADPLLVDNARYVVTDVRPEVRVLLVDGEPGRGRFEGQTGFFAAALAPRAGAGLVVEQISWLDLATARFSGFDAVVLANVPDVGADAASALRTFVENGGGLFVAMGDQVDPRVYNPRLVDGASVLPARIGEAMGESGEDAAAKSLRFAADHPATRLLAGLPTTLLDEARISRAFALEPVEGAQTIAWLEADHESSLLITREIGRGRVMLLATSLNREWTDLPVHPAFPILAQQSMSFLTRRDWEEPRRIGEPLLVTLPGGSASEVRFVPPGDGASEPITVRPTELRGRLIAELPETRIPGFYSIDQAGATLLSMAVNIDPSESDVRVLGADELRQELEGLTVRILEPGADVASAVRELRVGQELWKPLLLLALVAFLSEGFLARRFTARSREMVSFASATGREVMDADDSTLAEAA